MPVIVTSDFPPAHGGIQRYAIRLAEELHAAGLPVVVVAPDLLGTPNSDAALAFPVIRYPAGQRRVATVASMIRAARVARRQADDRWVVAMSWYPAGIAARLAGFARVTVLAHGSEIARQSGGPRAMLLRAVLRRTDVVANSRFTAALLRQRGVSGVRIVPCGVDAPSSPPPRATRSNVPTIVSVGRLVRRKGFDRLVEAMPSLARRIAGVRLVIVGEGPDRGYLAQLARERGVEDRVELLGAIDDAELARCFDRAWCFAMPNRAEGHDVEGFGIVFLEAATHGLPSVGGRGSGADDAIVDERTGYLVDPNDCAAIEHALFSLLSSPERTAAMGEAARARALAEFRWSTIASRIACPE